MSTIFVNHSFATYKDYINTFLRLFDSEGNYSHYKNPQQLMTYLIQSIREQINGITKTNLLEDVEENKNALAGKELSSQAQEDRVYLVASFRKQQCNNFNILIHGKDDKPLARLIGKNLSQVVEETYPLNISWIKNISFEKMEIIQYKNPEIRSSISKFENGFELDGVKNISKSFS